VDQIVAEVSYFGKKEHYKILTIDKKPPSAKANVGIAGVSSEGDFERLVPAFCPRVQCLLSDGGSRPH
jgi:hypothetical protein